jgi:uncharacterized membrane-anchored protein YhcB (DUF1043 family)
MTCTHDPSTDEGLLRTLIQDDDCTDYVFEDDELTNVLDQNEGDIWSAAADLCRALAAKYAKSAIFLNLGKYDLVVDSRKKVDYFTTLAKTYETKAGNSVAEYMDSVDYSTGAMGEDTTEYVGDE